MAERIPAQNRPRVAYRVELEKKIQINKSYSERRNQAIALRILSYGLFGQKRYQNLYLSCSLNCFYYGLKIANAIHRRVAGLAMIIRFETAHVIEYYEQAFEGKTYGEKKYSKINIKLTKTPTEEDKNEPGFNPGLSAQNIEHPLTDVILRKERPENGQQRRGGFRGRGRFNRGGSFRGGERRPYGGYRRERQEGEGGRQGEREVREPRRQRENRPQYRDYNQFRSGPSNNRYEEQQDKNRGQRRTRGNYQRGSGNQRYQERGNNDDDRTFDRRRTDQRGEDRGERRPQRYRKDSD